MYHSIGPVLQIKIAGDPPRSSILDGVYQVSQVLLRRLSQLLGHMLEGTFGEQINHFCPCIMDPVNGSNTNVGDRWTLPVADIATAYGKCTANQHDVVLYLASSSGVNLSAALTWSKNYTHLIGMCAPTMAAQRARIFQLSTLTGASPLVTVSASGCIFKNFYCFQGDIILCGNTRIGI